MLKKINIDSSSLKPVYLNQAYSSGLKFSIADKTKRRIIPWMTCKDYVQDLLWSIINDWVPVTIYGFSFGKNSLQPSDGHNIILFTHDTGKPEDIEKHVINSVELVNDFFGFKNKKLKKLKVMGYSTSEEKSNFSIAVKLPTTYFSAGPLISLVILLLRVGGLYDKTKYSNPLEYIQFIAKMPYNQLKVEDGILIRMGDLSYCNTSLNAMSYLFSNAVSKIFNKEIKDNWPGKEVGVGYVHSNTGIVAFANWFNNKKQDLEKGIKLNVKDMFNKKVY